MFKKNNDIATYGLIGIGVFSASYLFMRSRTASAATRDSFFSTYTPRKNAEPLYTEVTDPLEFSKSSSKIPSMVLQFDENSNDMKFGKLNFTPRKMSTQHDEREYGDIALLEDAVTIPEDFISSSMDPEHMIHPNDFQILKSIGVIPHDFPLHRTQYVKSLNGKNEFIVGYSEPKLIPRTNRHFPAVTPLWAVSVGRNFDTRSTPPDSMSATARPEFLEAAKRVLAAEYMITNTGVNGCLPGVGRNLCDLERATILAILLRRREIRDLKKNTTGTYENIAFENKGQTWSRHSKYLSGYNGHLGSTAHANIAFRQDFPQEYVKKRFDALMNGRVWHLPVLSGNGVTHFAHYNSLSDTQSTPLFLRPENQNRAYRTDPSGYAHANVVRVGGTVASNHGRTFK